MALPGFPKSNGGVREDKRSKIFKIRVSKDAAFKNSKHPNVRDIKFLNSNDKGEQRFDRSDLSDTHGISRIRRFRSINIFNCQGSVMIQEFNYPI